ncbi:MAG TPA: hypothetical protein VGN88_13260 [Phycisphaerae bacterium]|jgi:hypothetical protein
MLRSARILFENPLAGMLLAEWGMEATAEHVRVHEALAARKVTPDEKNLRAAAEWLGAIFERNRISPLFDAFDLAEVLGEKSAMVLRVAQQHAPGLALELEGAGSAIHGIEAAARFLPAAGPGEGMRAEKLRERVAAIELPEAAAAGADATWHENRRRLQQLVMRQNPARFLSWPVIMNSMFMNDAKIAGAELAVLKGRGDYGLRWNGALREDAVGAPARTRLHKESSNNLIHHAHNILQLELHAGVKVEEVGSILEFGGGYGSTARLALRLGFGGVYTIFDLPEFAALQQFYLGSLGMPVGSAGNPSVRSMTSVNELRQRFFENVPELFLATWSLSETPAAFREQFEPLITGARYVLIAYQESFGQVDNVDYFAALRGRMKGHVVTDVEIGHLPGNRYFVARAK